jgi:hypothetical protein
MGWNHNSSLTRSIFVIFDGIAEAKKKHLIIASYKLEV